MFSAATLVDVEISNRIFTTIQPNKGIAYVRARCPCTELQVRCTPVNSLCRNGTRLLPINIVDIAGLVPDAHQGRGLGNQFLSDIMQADALIHVVDVSGSTDKDGNPVGPGTHDPAEDVAFFTQELDYWMLGIVQKMNLGRRVDLREKEFIAALHKQLAGLGIALADVEYAAAATGLKQAAPESAYLQFIELLRKKSKPITIAANKADVPGADKLHERLKERYDAVPCSAAAELMLRRAAEQQLVTYAPGDGDFAVSKELDDRQRKALDIIRALMKRFGSTGVQQALEKAVFGTLGMIAVYPVENEHKFSDKQGRVLPDVFLMKKGSTALDLAFKVHEDIGKKFIAAVDARTHKSVSASYQLKHNDTISIKAGR